MFKYFRNKKKLKIVSLLILIAIVVLVFSVILKKPSHDRDWWESLSVLPNIEINGDRITIRNVRDWHYDENGPVSKDWIDRTYNLNDLEKVWFIVTPFSERKYLAHTMLSFDFKGQKPLSLSIEARKEIGEEYKLINGLLHEYELMYIWGTEDDFIGDRIITRGDTVYMYPLKISSGSARSLLVKLLYTTNQLYVEPRFYSTLVHNCTNELAIAMNAIKPGAIPMDISRVLSGHTFDLLFRLGYIDDTGEREGVRNKYNITEIVKKTINSEDFSEGLRSKIYN